MQRWRWVVVLPFAAMLSACKHPAIPDQPEAMVNSLYTQVLARHPHDTPDDWKLFAPYISQSLLRKIEISQACSADWDKQNSYPPLKAEMASDFNPLTEGFWGSGSTTSAPTFALEPSQPSQNGSLRIYVTLTDHYKPPERDYSWRVAPIVIRENGRYAIDDVTYVNDNDYGDHPEEKPPDKRLTGYLSAGCDGPYWVRNGLPDDPEQFVQSLYQQVRIHQPLEIPFGEDWKALAPYMSKNFLHAIDRYNTCLARWEKQAQEKYPDEIMKPPQYEGGIFSGGNERVGLDSFQIEKTQRQKDGSVRVQLRLFRADDNDTWHVVDILRQENGHTALDDVIFLKDHPDEPDYSATQILTGECRYL